MLFELSVRVPNGCDSLNVWVRECLCMCDIYILVKEWDGGTESYTIAADSGPHFTVRDSGPHYSSWLRPTPYSTWLRPTPYVTWLRPIPWYMLVAMAAHRGGTVRVASALRRVPRPLHISWRLSYPSTSGFIGTCLWNFAPSLSRPPGGTFNFFFLFFYERKSSGRARDTLT